MKIYCIQILLVLIILTSCNDANNNQRDITPDYIIITEAIKTSKYSRLAFQDQFATALDSFLINDNPNVDLNSLSILLKKAIEENTKAKALINATNEIDSTLKYKAKALDLFLYLDSAYTNTYPKILKIMLTTQQHKKEAILPIISPSANILKIKAKEVIATAEMVKKKYNLNLINIESH